VKRKIPLLQLYFTYYCYASTDTGDSPSSDALVVGVVFFYSRRTQMNAVSADI